MAPIRPLTQGSLVRVVRRKWGTPGAREGGVFQLIAEWALKPMGGYEAYDQVAYELLHPDESHNSELITGSIRPLTEDEQAAYSLGGVAAVECLPWRKVP